MSRRLKKLEGINAVYVVFSEVNLRDILHTVHLIYKVVQIIVHGHRRPEKKLGKHNEVKCLLSIIVSTILCSSIIIMNTVHIIYEVV